MTPIPTTAPVPHSESGVNRGPEVPYLTMAEIESTYAGRWVLIDRPKMNRDTTIKGGWVIFHTTDPEELNRAVLSLPRPYDIATYYMLSPEDRETDFLL